MNKLQIEARKAKGKEIAWRFNIHRAGNLWSVPSSKSGHKRYAVQLDPTNASCTCPDRAETGEKCKHIYAVEYHLGHHPDAEEPWTATDQTKRPNYPREWSRYNAAQTSEEDELESLLSNLCVTIPRTVHQRGRPPVPIGDAAFAAIMKVFLTKSARRVIPRLRLAYERGYLERPVTFNTILGYLEKPQFTPILNDLLIKSSLPVSSIETVFAIDSTGVVGNRFVRWTDVKYRGMTEHVWAKVHLMGGVKTHIITAAVILDRDASDLVQLPKLLHTTAQNFTVRQVCADAAYSAVTTQEEIAAIGAEAFIPFKSTHTGRKGGLWAEKFRQWRDDRPNFLKYYHQRSNIETAIMMWKTSFGDGLRSKTETAMKNEVYCKLICHNLSCLIKAMYELGLGAEFLAASFQKDAAD
jgi:transposase